jgi:hypothetical protein
MSASTPAAGSSDLVETRVIAAPAVAEQAVARLTEVLAVDRVSGPCPSRKSPGLVLYYLAGRLRAPRPAVTIRPQAALDLIGWAARCTRLLIDEAGFPRPHLAYHLAGALEEIAAGNRTDPAFLGWMCWAGRRKDMADAFARLNPDFGVQVHHGATWARYDIDGVDQHHQAAAQRRELELSMGERFARLLAPAHSGGEAA